MKNLAVPLALVAAFVVLISLASQAWQPEGWVNHVEYPGDADYAFSQPEQTWYYLRQGDEVWRRNLDTDQWGLLAGDEGWTFYSWPYGLSEDGYWYWYWYNIGDRQWCVNMDTDVWSYFGAPGGMAGVGGDSFQMGDSQGGGGTNETPVHTVQIDAFYMDQHEVRNTEMADMLNWAFGEDLVEVVSNQVVNVDGDQQVLLFMDDSDCEIEWDGSSFSYDSGRTNYPCVEVSWYGAAAYCNFRSLSEGFSCFYDLDDWSVDWDASGYRLPTEAEWEFAARGGKVGTNTLYSGSDDADAVAWHLGNSSLDSHPVGTKAENELDIYDLSGNVWEWCGDWYDSGYYAVSTTNNPTGPASGTLRVQRGGGWGQTSLCCRVSERIGCDPAGAGFVGFRCVRSAREADSDNDGLSDAKERYTYETDPYDPDTDGDGLEDGWEADNGCDPNDPNDPPNIKGTVAYETYSGGQEGLIYVVATSSNNDWSTNICDTVVVTGAYHLVNLAVGSNYWVKAFRDTDGDGFRDTYEACGSYTNNPVTTTGQVLNVVITMTDPDTDADGIGDWWEVDNGLNPLDPADAELDPDGDAASNHDEFEYGTDPAAPDTDGDLLIDSAEVFKYFTEPLLQDTDGDGRADGIDELTADCFASASLYIQLLFSPDLHLAMFNVGNESLYEFYFTRSLSSAHPWVVGETATPGTLLGEIHWYNTFTGPGRADGYSMFFWGGVADDSDGDGLGDGFEVAVLLSYPDLADSDSDGVSDADEDLDGDGKSNLEEYNSPLNPGYNPIGGSSNPWQPDSDGDGVCDGALVPPPYNLTPGPDAFPLDPAGSVDTDGDGKPNELHGTSNSNPPLVEDDDDDNDGLSDAAEIENMTDPLDCDSDGDGLPDGWEVQYSFDPLDPSDGAQDSDGDGMPNGWELQHGLDPLALGDGAEDADGDGIPNADEYAIGSDPNLTDTVVDVDPADVVLETKCVNYGELRGGFKGYLNSSNYYLVAAINYTNYVMHSHQAYESVTIDRNAKRMLSNRTYEGEDGQIKEVNLDSWSLDEQLYLFTDYQSQTTTNTFNGDVDIRLSYDTLILWEFYANPEFIPDSDSHALRVIPDFSECEYSLSDLYTVQEFQDDVEDGWQEYMEGGSTNVFADVAWNDNYQLFIMPHYGYDYLWNEHRYYTDIGEYGYYYEMEEYNRAVRDMAENTEWMHLSAIQYRWKLPDATDVVYRINSLHIFEPEDTNQTAVVEAAHRDYVKGTGAGGYIYTQPRFILPPAEEGVVEVNALKIEFVDWWAGVDELRISKWPNAFSGTNAVFDSEFIDTDPDRFAIRVEGLPENAGPFSIALSTDNEGASAWNDGPNEMVLYEQSLGVYTSKTMILVSNEIDDNETHDGSDGAISGPPDNSVDDRTHMALPGGIVQASFQIADHVFETSATVPLDGTVYLEMVVPLNDNDEPLVDNSYVVEQIRVLKETFAQTGLKTHAYITHMDIPSGVNLDDGLVILDPDVYGTNWVNQETRNLISAGGTVPDTSDIHVFYTREMFWNTYAGHPTAGMQINPSQDIAPSHMGYTYNAFISTWDSESQNIFLPFCPAHELVHLLSGAGDEHRYDKPWNLMDDAAVCHAIDDISNPKRLDEIQEWHIDYDDNIHITR